VLSDRLCQSGLRVLLCDLSLCVLVSCSAAAEVIGAPLAVSAALYIVVYTQYNLVYYVKQ